jgi:ADP-ribose pyrophosphatase
MKTDPSKLQPWTTANQNVVFETPWFKIRKRHMETPGGKELDYYIHEGNDSVICVCVDLANKTVLVEQQYRPPVEKVSVDYPAGRVEADDASTEAAIRRELQEEVGFKVNSIKRLAILDKDPGFSQTRMHVFLAQGNTSDDTHPDETESIVADFVPAAEILQMITDGTMSCVFCLSSTLLAFKELGWLNVSTEL